MLNTLIPVASASYLEAQAQADKQAADAKQNSALIQGLAAHCKSRWELMQDGRTVYEERLSENLLQRRGEYSAKKLAEIKEFGGSEIFLNITSTKCRAGSAWLRDTMMGSGVDKPWGLDATPIADLPPDVVQKIHAQLTQMVMQFMAANGGMPPPEDMVRQQAEQMRDQIQEQLQDEAKKRVDRMERKMEDQLVEGGFRDAMNQFIDDITTFPLAIVKGPVPSKRKTLKWNGDILETVETIRDEWARVDPFKFYFAPWASDVNSGPIIERHQLTRSDLTSMIGVEGYSEADIRTVLSEFDEGGLRQWLSSDSTQADAEGKVLGTNIRDSDLIDAIQLWDEVTGQKLIDWGMDAAEITDPTSSYPCEVWLIGSRVIKAVLNYDPLGRKPYFVTSWEQIPGALMGNGIPDLIRDPQNMCNAAARALSNNMGVSSGPQVGVNVDRLPTGDPIQKMRPWQIWQFHAADYQDGTPPISFFQPNSNAQELLGVFERFSNMADEYSGIPKYLQGEHTPGVGRTSSGLSMLLGNASKGMKQVVNNIDTDVLQPLLERQYQRNLRYSQDPDLIGDVNIVAKGAMSLVVKEQAAVRRNEFMQLALNSPVVQQIIGIPGTAELLRDAAKQLDMGADRIVPSREAIQQMVAAQQQQQAMMLQAAMNPEMEQVSFQRDEHGAVTGATKKKPKQLLPDGSPAGGRDSNANVNRVTGANR
jgi:hypothetical protein